MKDLKTKQQFIELRAKGQSFDKISKKLKVSKQTLINWSKELELEIANIKAIELEALQEKYYLTKEKRIELFGEVVNSLKEELEKRDLSSISTEKLIEQMSRYYTVLKAEAVEPVFKSNEEIAEEKARRDLLKTITRL